MKFITCTDPSGVTDKGWFVESLEADGPNHVLRGKIFWNVTIMWGLQGL